MNQFESIVRLMEIKAGNAVIVLNMSFQRVTGSPSDL